VPRFARRFWAPFALGVAGLAGLALQIAQQAGTLLLPPELAALPQGAVVLLLLVNPLILLLAGCAAGAACAHRTGLGSAVAGTARMPGRRDWAVAVAAGLALAAAIVLLDAWWAPRIGAAWEAALRAQAFSFTSLATGVLYGGLAEELMMRWGLMSTIAWGAHRLLARRHAAPPAWVMVPAIVLAALVFAAGHLPALAAAQALTPQLVARTLALNLVAGAVYGWLYWRRGLESAMAAHAATHVGFAALRAL
jgi:membrane protease YdiL (CAAX protease family)